MATNRRLVIRPFNSECRPIEDVEARIVFRKNASTKIKAFKTNFAGGEAVVPIPANVGHAVLDCVIEVPRYEHRSVGFLPFLSDPVVRDLWLPRNPAGGWNTRFTRWAKLGPEYEELKKVLRRSKNLHARIRRNGKIVPLGRFIEDRYDDVDLPDMIEAKAGLLNLYAKLMASTIPCKKGRPWFPLIKEIFFIQRDRIVGLAPPEMRDWVFNLTEQGRWRSFVQYDTAPAKNHEKNINRLLEMDTFLGQFQIDRIFSVKSTDEIGNLQLVIADVTDSNGARHAVLDSDVDENGRLARHIGDRISHRLTGKGTHPFHVYEILHRALDNPRLGYRLA